MMLKASTYKRWLVSLLLAALLASFMVVQPKAAIAATSVPSSRLEKLSHGVNTEWLRGSNHYEKIGAAQLKHMKDGGFKHVRIAVGFGDVYDSTKPSVPKSAMVTRIRSSIDLAFQAGLAVIIEMHDVGNTLGSIATDTTNRNKYADFWKALAAQLKDKDPERLFLEVMNEPSYGAVADWYNAQAYIISKMREGAPNHTIIADGNQRSGPSTWDATTGFTMMTPVSDSNVVYNLHFYDHFLFTHQGSNFSGWDVLQYVEALPHPSSPTSSCYNSYKSNATQEAITAVKKYCDESWNKAKYKSSFLQKVIDWKNKYQVPVTVNEIGVISWTGVSQTDNNRYHKDIREILEAEGIGWAVWDYGWIRVDADSTGYSPGILEALGQTYSTSTGDTQAPTTPTGLVVVSDKAKSLTLDWNSSSDNTGVKGYKVYNGSTEVLNTMTSSGTVFGLAAGTTYTLTVKAYDEAGNYSAGTSITATTDPSTGDNTAPSAPTGLVVTSDTTTSITLDWASVGDAAGYAIYVNGMQAAIVTSSSGTVSNLKSNTSYSIYVKAFDSTHNLSSSSSTITHTTD